MATQYLQKTDEQTESWGPAPVGVSPTDNGDGTYTNSPIVAYTKTGADAAIAAAVASGVTSAIKYRTTFDASGGTFPSSGGSGSAGAIKQGDLWVISVAGHLGTQDTTPGDILLAKVDTPGSTAGNWDLIEHDLGYTPENTANKDTDGTMAANSDTKYPSQKAVVTYVAAHAGGGSGNPDLRPSYATSPGAFDPVRSLYLPTNSDALRAWRAARGRAKAAARGVFLANPYAHILVIGDSHPDGKMDDTLTGGADWQINAWSEVMKKRCIDAGLMDGGTGWIKFGGLQNPSDPRWSTSGATAFTGRTGQTLFSWGNNTVAGMVAALTPLSPIADGVAVDILLKNTGKPWTLAAQKSDGTAVSSITTTRDGTNTLTVQSATGSLIGKLVATTLTGTGGNWNLGGGQIRRAGGLLVSNWAISNSYASHDPAFTTYWGWDNDPTDATYFAFEGSQALSIGGTPPVDLVIIQLGGNDDLAGKSDATIVAALTTIFARYPNASKMLVLNWGPDDTNRHNMFGAYYALADTLGIALFDTLHHTGGSTLMNGRGLYNAGSSLIHPNQGGHADIGDTVGDILIAA